MRAIQGNQKSVIAPVETPGVGASLTNPAGIPVAGQNSAFSYLTKSGKTANISNVNQLGNTVEFDAAFIPTNSGLPIGAGATVAPII